ncbi:MFS transporter [Ramlibacter albus]|uniref:MFS transporter n=1 Tax=Ramlibacter albus TaxID=2079448 RepID=UPI00338DB6FD
MSLPRALLVISAGVAAALHVGKLPPAVAALQQSLGLSLVDAGFLLSMVQLAGMTTAVVMGAWVDTLGLRRSIVAGLSVLAAASIAGGFAKTPAMLLATRAMEGFGFLMVVLPAPALVRALVPPGRVNTMMGVWGAYMPFATAMAMLAGAHWIAAYDWQTWWWAIGALSAVMAAAITVFIPPPPPHVVQARAAGLGRRLRTTLATRGPWLLALAFACYSFQWLAVVGFLPTIYEHAGIPPGKRGWLTALAAAVNIVGNVAAGRLLHRGLRPVALIRIGYVAMGVAGIVAFATPEPWFALRFAAVLAFSMVGGLIPGTLFSLALRLAPDERTVSTTVGWMQQWSALGQFIGPPIVAWIASVAGGWQLTWVATGTAALLGLALSYALGRLPLLR